MPSHSPRAVVALALLILAVVLVSCSGERERGERAESHEATHAPMQRGVDPGYAAPRIAQAVGNPNRNGFDTSCRLVKNEASDRIVFPNQPPPVGHPHAFFCTDVDHDSLLREMHQGETNSNRPEDTAGYWIPAILKPDGTNLKPQVFKAYYRTTIPSPKVPPENLKIVAGDRLASSPQDTDITWWDCKNLETGEVTGKWTEPHQCADNNAKPRLRITFPQCVATVPSDPTRMRVDSADHKSHMAYPVRVDGRIKCPSTHPVAIVRVGFQVSYPAASERGAADMSKVTYSSGGRYGSHGDFWQSFQMPGPNGLKQLTERCFQPGAFCKLGNEPI